ncbi:MAG: hypothetical protein ACJAYU_001148 [Bradymonadia bacterium]|jgi:uncharacterized protein YndB with AHSA1/START domain
MTDSEAVILERFFAASASSVWKAWTDPELLPRCYKPNNKCDTSVLRHDVSVGGVVLYQMKFGQMPALVERWEFVVIDEPTGLQWKQGICDVE